MPANLLKGRSPITTREVGRSGSTYEMSSATRRVVTGRHIELLPSNGLPQNSGNLPPNDANRSLMSPMRKLPTSGNSSSIRQHPLEAQLNSARTSSCLQPSITKSHKHGLFPTFQNGSSSASPNHPNETHTNSTITHPRSPDSNQSSSASSPGSSTVIHKRGRNERVLNNEVVHEDQKQSTESRFEQTGERRHASQSRKSSASRRHLYEDLPKSALPPREFAAVPRDPRVKLDPKVTMLSSHIHTASNISGDDRVQLKIAVEELRLIVKWREQQQQELQKRIGKLAGKYNKLLDLYISEKDRAENAFARLQKQLRELRHRDAESAKKLEIADISLSKQTEETAGLKANLERQKIRHESEIGKLEGHVDTLNSRLRALRKEKSEKSDGTSKVIKDIADTALCRWPSSEPDESSENSNELRRTIDLQNSTRKHRRGSKADNMSSGLITKKQQRQPVRPSKSGPRHYSGRSKGRTRSRLSQSDEQNLEEISDEDRPHRNTPTDSIDGRTNTTVSDSDSNSDDDGTTDNDENDDNDNNAEDVDVDVDVDDNNKTDQCRQAVDATVHSDMKKRSIGQMKDSLLDKTSAQSDGVPEEVLDNAARELEIVKIELCWKNKQIDAMRSRLERLETKGRVRDAAIDDSIVCEICRNIYQTPILLVPCGHSFCSSCLPRNKKDPLKCYECQSEVSSWVENHGLNAACEQARS